MKPINIKRQSLGYGLLLIAVCSQAILAADPVSLVTDFSVNTAPFDLSGRYVTSKYFSAPGCMGVSDRVTLSKESGWSYQATGPFFAGQNYPSFPMKIKFMMKNSSYAPGTYQQWHIDILARQYTGNAAWLGAYVGRSVIAKNSATSEWYTGKDTVINDFGDIVDQNGKKFRELYSGPVVLYFVVVPEQSILFVDDLHIADALLPTASRSNVLTVLPRASADNGELRVFTPNGRELGSMNRPGLNYTIRILGNQVRGGVTTR